jgi:hypothetical protein
MGVYYLTFACPRDKINSFTHASLAKIFFDFVPYCQNRDAAAAVHSPAKSVV